MKITTTAAELAILAKCLENEGVSIGKLAQAIINSQYLLDIEGFQTVHEEEEK